MPNRIIREIDKAIRRIDHHHFQIRMYIAKDNRPSSYPYVSGDSFRKLADYIHEDGMSFNPDDIKMGDIVFVSQPCLHTYLQTIHRNIAEPYILICHNGDAPVDEKIVNCIDDKIIHFFAQDVVCSHEKITPIPIGLPNLHYHMGGIPSVFSKIQEKLKDSILDRKNRIFYKFSINTNPAERGPAMDYFESHSLMETTTHFLEPRRYLKTLVTYKFVASPPGHAIESNRTWESLYIKTIPIVKDFVAMRYFASLGLPIWIIKDWRELETLTENDLAEKYDMFMENANWDAMYMDFWIEEITKLQKQKRKRGFTHHNTNDQEII